ncbi:MAG: SMR family transporter [bacterium]|nr:SMR family transporter [bacterium]
MPQVYLLMLITILTTVLAQICFKRGMIDFGSLDFSLPNVIFLVPRIFQNLWLLIGIFLFGVSFLFWLFIISKLQINIAYPVVLSTEVALVTVISYFLFKEYLSPIQVLGIAVIVTGIFLLLKH